MIFDMLRWWYGPGWLQAVYRIRSWTYRVVRTFSVPLLARTLFAPWRRIVTVGARSPGEKMQAMFDNLISRCVGFGVRVGVLLAAAVMSLFTALAGSVLAIAWPFMPLAFIYCVVRSITG